MGDQSIVGSRNTFTIGTRLREAAIEAGVTAGCNSGCHCRVTIAEAFQAADHIEAQAAEIERLKAGGEVIDAFKQGVDGIQQIVTEIIDGRAELTRLREVVEKRTKERDDYEYLLRVVCDLYKHDSTGYFLPAKEVAAQAAAVKGESDG